MTRILVVDDQAFVRQSIVSMLADKTAWELSEAENGKVAVDKTKAGAPDVVVLDIVMPVKDGITAAYEIGRIAPQTKILFISSHYTPQQASSFTRLFGAERFVAKSEVAKDLIPAINKALRGDA